MIWAYQYSDMRKAMHTWRWYRWEVRLNLQEPRFLGVGRSEENRKVSPDERNEERNRIPVTRKRNVAARCDNLGILRHVQMQTFLSHAPHPHTAPPWYRFLHAHTRRDRADISGTIAVAHQMSRLILELSDITGKLKPNLTNLVMFQLTYPRNGTNNIVLSLWELATLWNEVAAVLLSSV